MFMRSLQRQLESALLHLLVSVQSYVCFTPVCTMSCIVRTGVKHDIAVIIVD